MIKYLVKMDIDGIELRLIESKFCYVVIYGMERTVCDCLREAWDVFNGCVHHARDLGESV